MFNAKRKRIFSFFGLLAATVVIVLAVTPLLTAQKKGSGRERVDVAINKPFTDTISALKSGIAAAQLMIVSDINHQKMQMMIGNQVKGSATLEFFHPTLGKSVFDNDQRATLEVPMRMVVTEKGGKETEISYYTPSSLFTDYKGLKDLGKKLDDTVKTIIDGAKK